MTTTSGESHDSYNQIYDQQGQPQFDNQSSLGHEVLAGGAAFAGFKAFEDHQRNEGESIALYAHLLSDSAQSLTTIVVDRRIF